MQQLVKANNAFQPGKVIDIKEIERKLGYNTDMEQDVAKTATSAAAKARADSDARLSTGNGDAGPRSGSGGEQGNALDMIAQAIGQQAQILVQQDRRADDHAERMVKLEDNLAKQGQRLDKQDELIAKQDQRLDKQDERSDEHAKQMAEIKELIAKQDRRLDKQDELIAELKQRSDDHAERMTKLDELIAEQGRRIDKSDEDLERHIADNQKEHQHTRELFDSKFEAIKETLDKINGTIERMHKTIADGDAKNAKAIADGDAKNAEAIAALRADNAANAANSKTLIWIGRGLLASAVTGLVLAILDII